MQEQNENTNLFLKKILLWNLMLQLAIIHSFFVQNPWVVTTHDSQGKNTSVTGVP